MLLGRFSWAGFKPLSLEFTQSLGMRGYQFQSFFPSFCAASAAFNTLVCCSAWQSGLRYTKLSGLLEKMRGVKTFVVLLVLLFGPFISLGKYIEGRRNTIDCTGLYWLTSWWVSASFTAAVNKYLQTAEISTSPKKMWQESWERESPLPHFSLAKVSILDEF